MREIKFRAWDKKLSQWIPETKDGFHIIGEVMMFGVIEDYISKNPAGVETSLERMKDIELIQFTGLTDKNGKEIYDGDILKVYEVIPRGDGEFDDTLAEAVWDKAGAWMMEGQDYHNYLWVDAEIEVICNIYENPELLKS